MKQINKYIVERLHINKDTGNHRNHHYNYHPKTRIELKELVDQLIKERGNEANLNDIDTSEIKDMSYMFKSSEFNGDISEWYVSNVEYMIDMFGESKFNGDISNWNVSNVENMYHMFYKSPLEKNPPKWYKE